MSDQSDRTDTSTPDSASTPQPDLSRAAIVARLRAAGCVFAEDEAELLLAAATTPADLATMVERRVAGEPLEQVVGWAEFRGLRIIVEPGVFVPRRRSELLAQVAIDLVAAALGRGAPGAQNASRLPSRPSPSFAGPPTIVVDLCCGSGAVAAAVIAGTSGGPIEVHAADIEPAAVRCARRNLAGVGQVHEGDLFAALPARLAGGVAVLVVNAPYVPSDAIALLPAEARDHEPRVALDGGADGLDVQRRVLAEAAAWLAPGGHVIVETSEHQAPVTQSIFEQHGLAPWVRTSDELDATVVIGSTPFRRSR